MIESLRRCGVEVFECHFPFWGNEVQERVDAVQGGWMKLNFWIRAIRTYWSLAQQLNKVPRFDILMVGYPGVLDVIIARFFILLRPKPLVWDVLMSVALISRERNLGRRNPLAIWLLTKLELIACRVADELIIDTLEYAQWFESEYKLSRGKFLIHPLGADSRFEELSVNDRPIAGPTRILYYGSVPNHGVPLIVEAARLLANESGLEFHLIGSSVDMDEASRTAKRLQLKNIRFSAQVTFDELLYAIASSDICLGSFTEIPQGLITVQNKVIECMAAGRVVITGDSPATRRLLRHRENIWLIRREDARAIADAVLVLHGNPSLRLTISQNARVAYQENFAPGRTGEKLRGHLLQFLK